LFSVVLYFSIRSTLQSISSSLSSDSNATTLHGVDWTNNAYSTSHCWFPYAPNDPSSSLLPPSLQTCSFVSCQNRRPALLLSLLQCESCLILVHTQHLIESQATSLSIAHSIPPCRPSFYETNSNNDKHGTTKLDQHFWTDVNVLTKPCAFCKRKSISNSLFGSSRASTMPIIDFMNHNSTQRNPIAGFSTLSGQASGLQCSWCSRGYHRHCWEHISSQDDKNKCDYGIFRLAKILTTTIVDTFLFFFLVVYIVEI
jgi:hypothetical protein